VDGRPDLIRRAGEHPGTLGTVGIALVFGLVIMAMVYATGHLSGAHLNPAVTLAFALTRHFPRRETAAYPAAQLSGALAAAALLAAVWPSSPPTSAPRFPPSGQEVPSSRRPR
jgi:glycerol uptake facilitator-like aquaporin